jgi:hypothetical protein
MIIITATALANSAYTRRAVAEGRPVQGTNDLREVPDGPWSHDQQPPPRAIAETYDGRSTGVGRGFAKDDAVNSASGRLVGTGTWVD